jgi:hypothetical protein
MEDAIHACIASLELSIDKDILPNSWHIQMAKNLYV